jgi:hypothetical protein
MRHSSPRFMNSKRTLMVRMLLSLIIRATIIDKQGL